MVQKYWVVTPKRRRRQSFAEFLQTALYRALVRDRAMGLKIARTAGVPFEAVVAEGIRMAMDSGWNVKPREN